MACIEIRKGPWTEQEDLQLVCYVGLFGERRWDFIAKVSGLNRSGKSCRLRWVNYLRPDLKRGKITPQEECLILDLQSRWGNRWSRIARKLPGRTDNEIKNYWRTHMRKKAQERRNDPSPQSCSSCLTSDKEREGRMLEKEGTKLNKEEGGEEGKSLMEEIWKEIEDYEGEFKFSSSSSMESPLWEYSWDSLWKMETGEEESLAPMCDPHDRES
ncbi:hypothetical protein AMTRI_Chr08g204990 [Amborella trichopoda]|uniref:Uncharacterized protein n=1 Tax=Amborella trichopoda TaxID=13333 RepID=W1PFW4_AMBTC|nr:transcription factor MYB59 [Amborella trichopoda]ERN05965.1 hypothetical protein AMTR_s00145p00098450 [Amborella trichopoda]|eukprot:XP_006844290.1 transcription factor MYB59 [Amborella trichopoda]